MPYYDFSAPFVAARIVLPSGDTFPLWTNVGGAETTRPVVPGTEEIRALAFVQEVQVQLNLSGLPQISVQLSPPFEDGKRFLDSPLADPRLQNRIEVQLGYAGGTDAGPLLSPPFVAALQAPEVSIDVDIQITLKGTGLGNSARLQGGRVVGTETSKRWHIIQRLARGDGSRRTLEVDFSAVYDAGRDSEPYRLCDESAAGYAQGGRTDWLALWEMADLTRCIMVMGAPREDGGPAQLQWVPRRSERFTGPPTRRYRLFHFPGGQLRGEITSPEFQDGDSLAELPILSFSCNTEAVWGALTYQDYFNHGARMDGVNEDEVEAESTTVTVEGEAPPVHTGEGVQTTEPNDELPESAPSLPGSPDNPDAVRRAGNEVADSGPIPTRCEIETVGDPGVSPGDIVSIAGVGRRFDNRVYMVFEVTHSAGLSGYSTNLVIQSNADSVVEGRTPTGQPVDADREAGGGDDYTASSDLDPYSVEDI